MFKVKKGFTVIEIAIVVAIVAILAGVWYVSKNRAGADQKDNLVTFNGKVIDAQTKKGVESAKVVAVSDYSSTEKAEGDTDSGGLYTILLHGVYDPSVGKSSSGKVKENTATIEAGATGYATSKVIIKYHYYDFYLERDNEGKIIKHLAKAVYFPPVIELTPLLKTGTVEVTVTDSNVPKNPIYGAKVSIGPIPMNKDCSQSTVSQGGKTTDTTGKITLLPLAGKYCLITIKPIMMNQVPSVNKQEIEVKAGETLKLTIML